MNLEAFDFDGDYGDEYEELAYRVIPGYETLFPMVSALLDPLLAPSSRVLVVGAGTGVEIVALKRARPDLTVLGVDPSVRMLDLAKIRAREAGIESGVGFFHGYTHEVPSKTPFQAATLINVLHFVPDDGSKLSLLTDVSDRLEVDAPLVLFDVHGDPTSEEFARYMPAWRRFWSLRGFDADRSARFDHRIRSGIEWASAARILELAKQAGLGRPRMFYKSLLYGGWTFHKMPIQSD